WELASLPPGDSFTIQISGRVLDSDQEKLHNHVSFTSDNGGDGEDTEDTVVIRPGLPALSIAKTDSPDPVDAGDQLTYTITVTNSGNVTATNVTVIDDFDEDVLTITDADGGLLSEPPDIITWNGARTLDPYESLVLTVIAEVSSDAQQSLVYNTANVTCAQNVTDSTTIPTQVLIEPSRGDGGAKTGGGGEPTCYFYIDMLTEVTKIYVTCDDARCLHPYVAPDPNNKHSVELEDNTQVTYQRSGRFIGSPPRWIIMRPTSTYAPPPDDSAFVGPVYNFTGYTRSMKPVSTVNFDRAVSVLLDYPIDEIPPGARSIILAYYDEETGQWRPTEPPAGAVAEIGKARGLTRHFSTFAVIATIEEEEPASPPSSPSQSPPTPEPARFVMSGLEVTPSITHLWDPVVFVTRTGETVTVTATFTNDGEEAGTYEAQLRLDGSEVDSSPVTLGPGESTSLTFTLSDLSPGTHTVELAGASSSFGVGQIINWWIVVLAVLALALIILTSILLHRVRRRRQEAMGG
ncbi:MAG: DUF7507 domain-containing protein, partial [Chloroflexota bacterium]